MVNDEASNGLRAGRFPRSLVMRVGERTAARGGGWGDRVKKGREYWRREGRGAQQEL
jgi:hypothetical protein